MRRNLAEVPDTGPSALFAWPAQAAVNQIIAKNKIYLHAKPSAAVRALFVSQVESITWAYKLAPETINLPSSPDFPEFEVFEVALKLPELNPAVLRCIDKTIPHPILFVLKHAGRSQPIAAYKRPSAAAGLQWVVGDYHATSWNADSDARGGLPIALNLLGLYEQLLRQHLALPARLGESLPDQLERLSRVMAKETSARKLEVQLAQEVQFNRKVEINAQLRTIRHELAQLKR
jgi:hypothetical protein